MGEVVVDTGQVCVNLSVGTDTRHVHQTHTTATYHSTR